MKTESKNVYKIRGAHLQYMKNYYAKFEYKEMKTARVTFYTNQTPSPLRISDGKMSLFNTRKNCDFFFKCAQNKRCTFSMYEQSLGKFEYTGMKTI